MQKRSTESKSTPDSRRRLLKALSLGGAAAGLGQVLPERWVRPIVNSVVLPAHAQLSPGQQVVTFSSCSLSNATYNGTSGTTNQVSVNIAYFVSSNFGLDLTNISTIDITFTFQPSGTTATPGFAGTTDAAGNGSGSVPPPAPISAPAGQTAVSMTITGAQNIGGASVVPCTTAQVPITP